MPRFDRISLLLAGAFLSGQAQGEALARCVGTAPGPTVSLRIDNDILGAQDQGYSNGIQLRITSNDINNRLDVNDDNGRDSFDAAGDSDSVRAADSSGFGAAGGGGGRDSPGNLAHSPDRLHPTHSRSSGEKQAAHIQCRWPLTAWLARRLGALTPAGSTQQNLTFSLSQTIFTPTNRGITGVIEDDRPYAAALLLGLGYNARSRDHMQASLLEMGIVGPSARGEQAQNQIHKLTGDKPFLGWHNQLHDEVVFRLQHERLQRHVPSRLKRHPESRRWDAVTHWGASLGNHLTQASLGGELRWGRDLPDDFGSSPTRPAGETITGHRHDPAAGLAQSSSAHGFVSVNARWVLRDITLDGNTFRHSHRVDKEPFVADFGYGFALTRGPWKMVLARIHRTREFRGQKELPVFGSVTVSRRLSL